MPPTTTDSPPEKLIPSRPTLPSGAYCGCAAAQITGVHIPFKGTPEALTEVIAGRVDAVYVTIAVAIPGIQANRLVPLAIGVFAGASKPIQTV